jgi:endonuclease/exonuclease/phosphatase family metal-dependent hydrolase
MKMRVLSLNIHKGFSAGNRRFILPGLREAFRQSGADLIFLQEVLGRHEGHAQRFEDWPDQSQTEYLADSVWKDHAYGQNALYDKGDHGNAVLSRYPLSDLSNTDISSSRFEKRGFQFARLVLQEQRLHLVNLHLSLLHRDRLRQIDALIDYVEKNVPAEEPLIVAGDFNDWSRQLHAPLENRLGLVDVFKSTRGSEARTFPYFLPLLPLDRIYARGLQFQETNVLNSEPWNRLSDHLPLCADFEWSQAA